MVLNASTTIRTAASSPREALATSVFSSRYLTVLVLVVLAIWCWVDVWPRGRLDPMQPHLHSTDFTVYTNAGKAAMEGVDPYSVTNARGWKYLYLPPFALLVSPLALLSEGWQCVIWFWISIACLFGAFREFTRLDRWAFPGDGLLRRTAVLPLPGGRGSLFKHLHIDFVQPIHSREGEAPAEPIRRQLGRSLALPQEDSDGRSRSVARPLNSFAVWGGMVCMIGFSLSTLNCLQRGQVGVFQLYLTLLGVRLILTNATGLSAMVGGSVLAGAIILKLSPALPATALIGGLVFLALRKRDQSSAAMLKRALTATFGLIAGLVVGIWILPASVVGWERNQTYLATWQRDVFARTNELSNDPFAGDSHSTKNQSPMNAFWLLGNSLLRVNIVEGPTHSNPENSDPMEQPWGKQVLYGVRVVSILATGIVLLAILWRGNANALLVAFAVANAATLLVVPIARGHYFMAIWPAAVWVPRWLKQSMQLKTKFQFGLGWLTQIPPALLMMHYLFEKYVGAWGVLGVGVWLWYLLMSTMVVVTVFSAENDCVSSQKRRA